jgi:hypothetical protein
MDTQLCATAPQSQRKTGSLEPRLRAPRVAKVEGRRPPKRRTSQEAIPNRFPAGVDRELFERVNARLITNEARGKNAVAPLRSIFAGVMKCQHCGGHHHAGLQGNPRISRRRSGAREGGHMQI